ncbi:MAG TPA: hypothetical protein EYQ24_07075 [Bacteroidetes bacterium]|nr:hypothetical protein [Bacteroidota bacterium]HIL57236.1 hypothetical protein [Rhodothermales bacterium]
MRLLVLAALVAAPAAFAQPASDPDPVAEVEAVITRLFDGMRAGDSTAVRATLHPTARFQTVMPQEGGFRLVEGSADRFVEAVGTPHEEVWDERIGEVEVLVDAGLATAWMPYRFYLGETFSHCGVNAMQLANVDGTWRIVNLIDTRRRTCE